MSKNHSILFLALAALFLGEPRSVRAASCLPIPPLSWIFHECTAAVTACAPSDVPLGAPVGATFADLTNKMAACCGRGWGENNNSAQKLDCVQALAPPGPTQGAFIKFYNAGGPLPNATVATAGLAYPNQAFILDPQNVPINGFYDTSGKRCNYLNNGTGAPLALTPTQQLAVLENAVTNMALPAGAVANAKVTPNCCNMVLVALERKCPGADVIGGVQVAYTDPVSGVRRCTSAQQMKLDFALIDLCDPLLTNRTRFRMATTFTGEDPKQVSLFPNVPVDVSALILDFYPPPAAGVAAVCPASSAVVQIPWTSGKCSLANSFPNPGAPCNTPAMIGTPTGCGTLASYSSCVGGTENYCGCTCYSGPNQMQSW
jgi:hypothetical protein